MKSLSYSLLALVGSASLLAAGPAFAHAKLIQSNPSNNAVVSAAPRTLVLSFNEKLVPAFSKVELTMPEHGMKVPVTSKVSADGKTIVAVPASSLHKGAYKMVWSAAGADGHKMTGEVSFKIG
ncbi:copper homeostasis periplasmic binding protein CopC [Altericroceibacterium xinjiangense]|uniref:copper homeostasis periplasmic binding protein CopC n=1 Tax=Altericroceibacterium xinjiangense TaxID=762261 RepID=UPI000F7F59BC|nr:copper homeostasis periplasmic binding protein CopC [Altericroceibacterium xinjiangense]